MARLVDAKPCGWCGAQPVMQMMPEDELFEPVVIACVNPKCTVQPTVGGDNQRQALARWNRREPLA